MLYEEEILYRKELIKKAHHKEKLLICEREWLVSHSIYNEFFGYPFYNYSIEKIEPNKLYLLKLKIESVSYNNRILPIVSVPAGKGSIVANFDLEDINGNKSNGVPVKAMGFEITHIHEFEVQYISKLGLFAVYYECDYFDEKSKLNKRENAFSGNPKFAMRKEKIGGNKVKYSCKSPVSDSFDALIFTIEWIE